MFSIRGRLGVRLCLAEADVRQSVRPAGFNFNGPAIKLPVTRVIFYTNGYIEIYKNLKD